MDSEKLDERLKSIEDNIKRLEALEKRQTEMLELILRIHYAIKDMNDNSLADNVKGNLIYAIMFGA